MDEARTGYVLILSRKQAFKEVSMSIISANDARAISFEKSLYKEVESRIDSTIKDAAAQGFYYCNVDLYNVSQEYIENKFSIYLKHLGYEYNINSGNVIKNCPLGKITRREGIVLNISWRKHEQSGC